MKVQVYRFKADHSKKKKGTILNFPSGPGATGDIEFASLREAVPNYDLISLDPRGVGNSSPLTCTGSKNSTFPRGAPPTTASGWRKWQKQHTKFQHSCTTKPRSVVRHMDAASVARDAEQLRRALHLPQVNLYGHSYGTLLAEKYLAGHGRHVRASILEGVMDPTQGHDGFLSTTAAASELAFKKFTDWCSAHTSCAVHGRNPAKLFRRAEANADAGRIPGTVQGSPWNADMVKMMFEGEVGQSATFAKHLAALAQGHNPIKQKQPGAGQKSGGQQPAKSPNPDPIACQDFPLATHGPRQARHDLTIEHRAAPSVGFNYNSSHYSPICAGWPGPAETAGTPATSAGSSPALLVSNRYDVATPHSWAQSVAGQLGGKGNLITVDRFGHNGSIGKSGCGRKHILAYLRHPDAQQARVECPAPKKPAHRSSAQGTHG